MMKRLLQLLCPVENRTRRLLLFGCLLVTAAQCDPQGEVDNGPETMTCPEGTLSSGDDCLVECPDSWHRDPDNKCRPSCREDYDLIDGECVRPCPEGTVPDGNACMPEAPEDTSVCPVDVYNDDGAEGALLYLDESAAAGKGDGSRAAPFATMTEVIDALEQTIEPVVSVLIASGEYDIEGLSLSVSSTVSKVIFLGRCIRDTKWFASPGQTGLVIFSQDTEFEFKRLNVQGGSSQIAALEAASTVIDDCSFADWEGSDAVLVGTSSSGRNRCEVRRSTFAVSSETAGTALGIHASDVLLSANQFTQLSGDKDAVVLDNTRTLVLTDNKVSGTGISGISVQYDAAAEAIDISRNHIVGEWTDAALRINGAATGNQAPVTVEQNTLRNESIGSETAALVLHSAANVTVRDLRVEGGGGYGLRLSDVGSITILDSTVRELPQTALWVTDSNGGPFESCAVRVESSHFEGMGEYAVFHADALCDLNLLDNILEDNKRGVWAKPRAVSVEGNDFAANVGYALTLVESETLLVAGNTIAGSDGFGIDISALNGTDYETHHVEQNTVVNCAGVGISLRDIGAGTAVLEGNRVSGTRRHTTTNGVGKTGTVGDGVSVVASLDSIKTTVKMVDNTVDRNARLGVIVHGEEAALDVSNTQFETGNGYGQILSTDDGPPNLTSQNNAAVSGGDAADVEKVSGVFVADNGSEEGDDE